MNPAEINYNIYDKELLTIVELLSVWQMSCSPFPLITRTLPASPTSSCYALDENLLYHDGALVILTKDLQIHILTTLIWL
jgi:hypothetical protein